MDGTSWADQWDHRTAGPPARGNTVARTSSGGAKGQKYKQKVNEGLQKTKALASAGFKKVKHGTTQGVHWVKDKYHKATQKH